MVAAKKTRRFYQNNRVSTEINDALTSSVFRHNGGLLAQRIPGTEEAHLLMGVSNTDTVLTELRRAGKKQFPYTPYGRRQSQGEWNSPFAPCAFNGEQLDSMTGCYLAGNGYRLYSPTLQRFCSPDNLSPFEKGGINAYVYCTGDPVNRVDPTGHFNFRILQNSLMIGGVSAFIVGVYLAVAGTVTRSRPLAAAGVVTAVAGTGIAILTSMSRGLARAYTQRRISTRSHTTESASSTRPQPTGSPQRHSPPRSQETPARGAPIDPSSLYSSTINGAEPATISVDPPPPAHAQAVAFEEAVALNSTSKNSPTGNNVGQAFELSTTVQIMRRH